MTRGKLLVALVVGAFVLDSTSALADDIETMPLTTMDGHQILAARAKAKARWAKMTPEEKARAQKIAARKNGHQLTALDEVARRGVAIPEEHIFRGDRKPIKPKPIPPEPLDKRDDGKKPSSD
jgi:hypothetical protein